MRLFCVAEVIAAFFHLPAMSAGGKMAQRPWQVLAANSIYNGDYFRQYVVNRQKFKPNVAMPAHPTFDSATLDALQAYFRTMLSE
jgi:hypothetical protein